MSTNPDHLAQAAAEDFAKSGRAELEAFAEMIGVSFHPNIGDEKLRDRLLEKLGKKVHEFPAEPTEQQVEDRAQDIGAGMDLNELFKLNLSPDGPWQGRRRMVQISRPEGWKGNQPQPFRWGRSMVMVPFNRPVSVPYPVYHIMKNSVYKELRQIRETASDGTGRIRNTYEERNRWNLTDMGDDQSTAHLPVSQKEQFRYLAENTGMFKNMARRQLILLARRLRVRIPNQIDPGEQGDQSIRDRVLAKLGYDMLLDFAA